MNPQIPNHIIGWMHHWLFSEGFLSNAVKQPTPKGLKYTVRVAGLKLKIEINVK